MQDDHICIDQMTDDWIWILVILDFRVPEFQSFLIMDCSGVANIMMR